jgi:hypothetical protein
LTARRPVLALVLVTAIALVWSASAMAASPQRIYKDLADNGRLDGKYSRADLARAFNLQQVVKTDEAPAVRRPPAAAPKATPKRSNRRVPFTGIDAALLVVGGAPLLLIGVGLRRRVTATAEPAGIIGS